MAQSPLTFPIYEMIASYAGAPWSTPNPGAIFYSLAQSISVRDCPASFAETDAMVAAALMSSLHTMTDRYDHSLFPFRPGPLEVTSWHTRSKRTNSTASSSPTSGEIVAIKIHDLVPRSREVLHKCLL